jgi:hypothetical protein
MEAPPSEVRKGLGPALTRPLFNESSTPVVAPAVQA